ncbi:protein of unknown function [Methylorubrum extorquens]|uniref:Uncharacterized protein n=1 Tax=Methylorubrum extorquens TaxID=408 RepID=A0A2N9AVJ5_METEX|nr:protein of unknown function [Methylorubrum extorquens]
MTHNMEASTNIPVKRPSTIGINFSDIQHIGYIGPSEKILKRNINGTRVATRQC